MMYSFDVNASFNSPQECGGENKVEKFSSRNTAITYALTNQAKNITIPFMRYALDLFSPAVSRNLHKSNIHFHFQKNCSLQ